MLEAIKQAAYEAGELLKEGFEKNNTIEFKSEIDLVTEYDFQIEQFLMKKLGEAFSEYEVIGEETGSNQQSRDKKIIIDPIDGTTNFIHRIPIVGISIGVVENGEAVAGVVYNPLLDEMYWAQKGQGSYCNDRPLSVTATDTLTQSLIATGFPYTKIDRGDDYRWTVKTFENILPFTRDMRRLGAASIDLCYVASGVYDGYYEINLKPWDVAAGVVIVTEAGGKISGAEGKKYDLEDKLIIASNGKIHDKIIEKMADMN